MLNRTITLYNAITSKLTYAADALLLAMRFWLANIFWYSGVTKLEDWDTTLFLFEEEYQVPFLPTEFAAYSGTFFELACPILLVLGLGTRVAALPLIAMTAVIQFTYQHHEQHYYWAFLLFTLVVYGGGRASIDHFVARYLSKQKQA